MHETEEQRQIALKTAGNLLTFSGFTIYGISGFSVSRLYGGESSVYGGDRQEFTVTISALDANTYSVVRGDTFTLGDGANTFGFMITNITPDLEGMKVLTCDLRGITNV